MYSDRYITGPVRVRPTAKCISVPRSGRKFWKSDWKSIKIYSKTYSV